MFFADDSPLRRVPTAPGLLLSQRMFLDGIRYSIEMADLSFRRLKVSLLTAMTKEQPPPDIFTSAFLDAWSLVDSAYRLLVLHRNMRGIKNTPAVTVIRDGLAPAEDLRHSIQHLNKQISAYSEAGYPTWGSLSWVASPELSFSKFRVGVMVAGSLGGGELTLSGDRETVRVPGMVDQPIVDPLGGRKLSFSQDLPVDLVELTAYQKTISLSETFEWMARSGRGIEQALLQPPWAGASSSHADLLLRVTYSPQGPGD